VNEICSKHHVPFRRRCLLQASHSSVQKQGTGHRFTAGPARLPARGSPLRSRAGRPEHKARLRLRTCNGISWPVTTLRRYGLCSQKERSMKRLTSLVTVALLASGALAQGPSSRIDPLPNPDRTNSPDRETGVGRGYQTPSTPLAREFFSDGRTTDDKSTSNSPLSSVGSSCGVMQGGAVRDYAAPPPGYGYSCINGKWVLVADPDTPDRR
jgi:hypothetical protein